MSQVADDRPPDADEQARWWVLGHLALGVVIAAAAAVRAAALQRCDGEGGGAPAALLGLVGNGGGVLFLVLAPGLLIALVVLRARGRWLGRWWPWPLLVVAATLAVGAVFAVLSGLCSGWDL